MGGAETRVLGKLCSSLPKQKPDRKRTGLAWTRVATIHEKLSKAYKAFYWFILTSFFAAIE